jgi:F-type H+-transporting ATPase subunit b
MTIDWWTLGIQAVNVLILVWLLARFFWRPVAAMIEQRRAAAQQLLAEAETRRSEATDALAEIDRTRAGFAREREAIMATAQQSAERARRELLASAEKEAAARAAAATAAITRQRDASERAWAERARRLAVDIAERLIGRLDGPVVSETFLGWLIREIRMLPEPTRHAMAADGTGLDLISATPIDPADQEHYRQSIGAAFGACPSASLDITFKVDPALIAGLELHGPHLVVNNSWRADLTKIVAELAHDERT